jgi:hypothetical protein
MGVKNYTEFQSELLFNLGRVTDTDLDSVKGAWINTAYLQFCSKNKFWYLKVPKTFNLPELDTSTTVSGADGDTYITRPDCFFVHAVWDMTSDNMLGHKDHAWYTEQTGRADANSEGSSEHWTPYGGKLYLHPTLDGDYNFTIYYRKRPELLTGSEVTAIGAEWDEPILQLATIKGLNSLREFDKTKELKAEFIDTVSSLMGMQERQQRYTRDRLQPSAQHAYRYGY